MTSQNTTTTTLTNSFYAGALAGTQRQLAEAREQVAVTGNIERVARLETEVARLEQLVAATISARITLDEADEIVLNSQYADMVDNCEETDDGYVYTLDNGEAVRVTFEGLLIAVEAPNMVPAMTLDEQIAFDLDNED